MEYKDLAGKDWLPVFGRKFFYELDKAFALAEENEDGVKVTMPANAGLTKAIIAVQTLDVQSLCSIIHASLSMEKSRPNHDAIYDWLMDLGYEGVIELCDSFFDFLTTDPKLKEYVKLLMVMQERLTTRGVRMTF